MARCRWCGGDMLVVEECFWAEESGVKFPDGEVLDAVVFAGPFGVSKCGDCNVRTGKCHHPGCCVERCPRCEGQLISCGCLDQMVKKKRGGEDVKATT